MPMTCYWSGINDFDVPCGPTNSSSPVVPCCQTGSTCYSDGLCYFQGSQTKKSNYYTAACSELKSSDPNCNNRCAKPGHRDVIYNASTTLWTCCGSDQNGSPDCRNPTDETFGAPAPGDLKAYYIAGKGAINGTDATTSSLATLESTTTTTTPISSVSSPSGASTSTSARTSAATPSPAPASSGLSTGAKAGIGVGVSVLVLAILSIIVLMSHRRRRKRRNAAAVYEYEKHDLVTSQPGLELQSKQQAAAAPIDQSDRRSGSREVAELHGRQVWELDAGKTSSRAELDERRRSMR